MLPHTGLRKRERRSNWLGNNVGRTPTAHNSQVQIYDPIAGVHIYDYTTDGEIWLRAKGGRIFDFTEQTVKKKSFIM